MLHNILHLYYGFIENKIIIYLVSIGSYGKNSNRSTHCKSNRKYFPN